MQSMNQRPYEGLAMINFSSYVKQTILLCSWYGNAYNAQSNCLA